MATPQDGLGEDVRAELQQLASRLRALADRSRTLELVCHDLARILERLARAGSAQEIEGMMIYWVPGEPTSVAGVHHYQHFAEVPKDAQKAGHEPN